MLFFSMLVMYSAFVLTSVDTEYYVQDIAKIYEYYVYFWGVGDLIEELISCFVSSKNFTQLTRNKVFLTNAVRILEIKD